MVEFEVATFLNCICCGWGCIWGGDWTGCRYCCCWWTDDWADTGGCCWFMGGGNLLTGAGDVPLNWGGGIVGGNCCCCCIPPKAAWFGFFGNPCIDCGGNVGGGATFAAATLFGGNRLPVVALLYPGMVGDCIELPFVKRFARFACGEWLSTVWLYNGCWCGCCCGVLVGLSTPLPLFKWTFCKFVVIRSRFNVFGVDVEVLIVGGGGWDVATVAGFAGADW